jgi:RNA ligase (TIGR02306 family)
MRGAISQGLLGELKWLESYGIDPQTVKEGDDMTDRLNVKKWVSAEEMDQYNKDPNFLNFPDIVPKTNEPRVQNAYHKLKNLENREVIITQKYDGTSATYMYVDGIFSICNRNYTLTGPTSSSDHYFNIAKKYDLSSKMNILGKNIAIQGEIIGPKINCNRHNVKDIEFYVFNIFDIKQGLYLNYNETIAIINDLGLKTVKVVYNGLMKYEWLSSKALLDLANEQLYDTGMQCEGIVIKSNDNNPRLSFKIISNKYLLKYKL